MQSVAVFVALLAAVSAHTVVRVPSADSAVISSQRVGGNFAYSTAENAAYGIVSPVVSQVATPVATTWSVPVQQQATQAVVSQGVPAATTYTAAVQNVLPVSQQQISTYGSWPYTQWAGASPLTYTVQANTVQVDGQKQVAGVQVAQPIGATTYTVQQGGLVSSGVQQVAQPIGATTYAVQQGGLVSSGIQQVAQPIGATTYTVQQGDLVSSGVQVAQPIGATTYTVQQGGLVSSGLPVASTYAVQAPVSVVAAGTPASTYKTVAGVSPLGLNYAYGYGLGQQWGVNTLGLNTVVV